MSNKSYWIKPAKKTVVPTRIVAVAVATKAAPGIGTGGKVAQVYARACMASATWRAGRWRVEPVLSPVSAPSLLRAVEEAAPVRGAVLVVAPVASHVLTLAGWYCQLASRGAKWSGRTDPDRSRGQSRSGRSEPVCPRRPQSFPVGIEPKPSSDTPIVSALVDRGNPDIIRYHVGGRTITWISGRQFFPQDEGSLMDSVGYTPEYSGDNLVTAAGTDLDPADRAALWLRMFVRFADWWKLIDGGPMGHTPATCAWNYVRKRMAPKSVLSCQEPDIRAIEEESLYGGQATTWFYGPVSPTYNSRPHRDDLADRKPYPVVLGPVDHWDVRSMYPTILATERFPTRYLYRYDSPTVASVSDMLGRWCVIARVLVSTETPDYPVRQGGRVIHPVGTFRATLTTPDLLHAVRSGHVRAVYRAVTYAAGRPFADAMTELIGQRHAADDQGDAVWSMFAKLLTNSFGGRLAMRSHGWKRAPAVRAARQWGEWVARDADTGLTRRYRSRAGLVDVWEDATTPTRPLAACFAHLTAYGRGVMRAIRLRAPSGSVLSQDTDGIWVARGRCPNTLLAGTSQEQSPYRLRLTESSTSGRWYGPRHYRVDSGWTLAGMHDPQRWSDGLSWLDSHSEIPRRTTDGNPPVWVYECQTRKRLGEIPADGTVGPDGWVIPFRLNQE